MSKETTPDHPVPQRFGTRELADQLSALDKSRAVLVALEDYRISRLNYHMAGLDRRVEGRARTDSYSIVIHAINDAPPELVSDFEAALKDHHRQRVAEAEAWLTRHGLEVPLPPELEGKSC